MHDAAGRVRGSRSRAGPVRPAGRTARTSMHIIIILSLEHIMPFIIMGEPDIMPDIMFCIIMDSMAAGLGLGACEERRMWTAVAVAGL